MAKKFYNSIRQQGMDYVHSQERADGAMISEDYSKMSNLPQNVVIREYPKREYFLSDELNGDNLRGVDQQINNLDGAKIRRGKNPKKF